MKRPKRDPKGEEGCFCKRGRSVLACWYVACEHADIRIPIGHSPLAFFPFPLNPTRSNCAEKRAKFLTQFNWKETLKYVEYTGSACPVNILGLKKREMLEIKKLRQDNEKLSQRVARVLNCERERERILGQIRGVWMARGRVWRWIMPRMQSASYLGKW